MVEVVGVVSNKGAIMASAYNMLREDQGILFGKYVISPVEKGMCSQRYTLQSYIIIHSDFLQQNLKKYALLPMWATLGVSRESTDMGETVVVVLFELLLMLPHGVMILLSELFNLPKTLAGLTALCFFYRSMFLHIIFFLCVFFFPFRLGVVQ